MINRKTLTVVFPVFNERKNLEFLVPEILDWDDHSQDVSITLLIVDDGSTDGSRDYANSYLGIDSRVNLLTRDSNPSLPESISEGIQYATTEYVAWLDADGSMPISDLVRMWTVMIESELELVIGSRFVDGGGFKGMNVVGKTNFFQFVRNIRDSKDSFSAVILSRCLNYFLRMVLRCGVHDLTSGFILVKKIHIEPGDISGAYGDYCPPLIYRLRRKNIPFTELGYICLPRKFGVSKTGASLRQYINRGIPYIFEAFSAKFRG